MQKVKVRDLGVFPDEKPIYPLYYSQVGKLFDGTPEGAFTTPWLRTDLGCFRIALSVISRETQHPEYALALSGRQAECALEKLAHMVKAFKKELR